MIKQKTRELVLRVFLFGERSCAIFRLGIYCLIVDHGLWAVEGASPYDEARCTAMLKAIFVFLKASLCKLRGEART